MTTSREKAIKLISLFSKMRPFEDLLNTLQQDDSQQKTDIPKIPQQVSWDNHSAEKRRAFLKEQTGCEFPYLSGKKAISDVSIFQGNIENYIGITGVPTGVIGPISIRGTQAHGQYYVPLATSEGALVASYNRGARATFLSGGIVSVCLTENLQRAPLFKFRNLPEVGMFMHWILSQYDQFVEIVSRNSRYARLDDFKLNMEGNHVVVIFEYQTGEAAGQNMVTICTHEICQYIVENVPVKPQEWYVESNYSGDKKATAVSFTTVRGKKITAESTIKRTIVKEVLGTTPEKIHRYWLSSSVTAVQTGSIGIQGHFANGLTALFLATGQDVACVSEAYVGITRMEVDDAGDLYICVTLPSLVVGTIGGGTQLPSQKECLELMGCTGPGSARKLAEICGATLLAGELSIAAAIANGNFAKAHKLFGRKK
jgi:hydroxymethylglutaryl-CoA reductase (NADPH)